MYIRAFHNRLRHAIGSIAIATLTASMIVMPAFAQNAGLTLTFKPHCILPDRTACPVFTAKDPMTLQTPTLKVGDILDVDIVVQSPTALPAIATVRSWVAFDPKILEARSIDLTPALSQPIPGEQSIDPSGSIKIGGAGMISDGETVVARVTFRVLTANTSTLIQFINFQQDGSGETSVNIIKDGQTVPQLLTPPTFLLAFLNTTSTGTTYSVSSSSSSMSSTAQTSTAPSGNSSFGLLQVQNVRVTTQDNDIFVGWTPLSTSQIAGYNVYYGTVSGRYIQRHSVEGNGNSVILRDLNPNTQYFVAVRGFNASNEETAFSQEVGVVVGRPETSTSPLSQDLPTQQQPVNTIEDHQGTQVSGETGLGSSILLLCLISAGVGTVVASRRHFFFRSR